MKLLDKTTKTYLMITVPIVVLSMVLAAFLIRYFNLQHVENNLKEEHRKIIKKSQKIKNYFIEDELSDELFVYEIPHDSVVKDKFLTVMVYDPIEKRDEPFRQMETMQEIAGKNYKIVARKSLVENTSLMYSIGITMFLLVSVIVITFVMVNRVSSAKTWKPFYAIMNNLQDYHAGHGYRSKEGLVIDEFIQLDSVIKKMTDRINKEFFIHKEFIDIIAHEYQTPLAVIRNEAELLLQNAYMQEGDMQKLGRIIEYVSKLSRLNRSLLTLSRIDNNQFDTKTEVDVKAILMELIEERRPQLEAKGIELKLASNMPLNVYMNSMLANILIGNLLQNAIRHNKPEHGKLIIEIRSKGLHFYNLGPDKALDKQKIFAKFHKEGDSKKSIGLGLSLVKSICDHYGYKLDYEYLEKSKEHHFSIVFE